VITYTAESTRIKGNCTTCGTSVDIVGKRHRGVRIGSDKRHLN
jgi:hypothetical protein